MTRAQIFSSNAEQEQFFDQVRLHPYYIPLLDDLICG